MAKIEPGQVWEMYLQGRWVKVVVTKIEYERVFLKYDGEFNFINVDVDEMEQNQYRFRRMEAKEN